MRIGLAALFGSADARRQRLERRRLSSRFAAPVVVAMVAGCGGGAAEPTSTAAPQAATKPSVAPAPADPLWHYEGAEGPDRWGTLSPKFAACGEGRAQSPIDIASTVAGTKALELKTHLMPGALRIAHHEHVADGINMHLVHKAESGQLAVIGVFIEQGAHNAAFDPIWNNLPKQKGVETHYPHVNVDVDKLLPVSRASYRYDGSLTTPPCSEGVRWIVMTTPIQLSGEQIKDFTATIHDNNRPPQPLNGRLVLTEAVTESR